MAVRLGRLIAVLFIAVLAGALYLGIQEQKIRTEKQASEIAKESFGFRVLKERRGWVRGEAAAEKITREEERQLQTAITLSSAMLPLQRPPRRFPATAGSKQHSK